MRKPIGGELAFAVFFLAIVGGYVGCGGVELQNLQPGISVADSIDFGSINVQTFLLKEIPIKNVGQANLVIEEISLNTGKNTEGDNWFEIVEGLESDTIPPGYTYSFRVKMFAYERGVVTDSVRILSNDEDASEVQIQLQGAVVKPVIEVYPGAISFGQVTIDETAVKSVSVMNAGDGDLSIIDLEFAESLAGEFTYTLPPTYKLRDPIPPGIAVTIEVVYEPIDDETDSGVLAIVTNDIEQQRFNIVVSGNGFEDTAPVVTIVTPSEGDSFYRGSTVVFEAYVSDEGTAPEDLDLLLSSSFDGTLCSNASADENGRFLCSDVLTTSGEDPQIITLLALDSKGQVGTDTVSINVWDEEVELGYVISGSSETSLYAFTPDDNLRIFVIDGETGEEAQAPCVNAMDDIMESHPPQSCSAKYGDTLHIMGYDRYGSCFAVPELYLWYGAHDEWSQPLVPELLKWCLGQEYYDSFECHPTGTREEWEAENPDTPAEDCLMYEDWVEIIIPPPEPTNG